jgi:hypothetical protein
MALSERIKDMSEQLSYRTSPDHLTGHKGKKETVGGLTSNWWPWPYYKHHPSSYYSI